MRISLTALTLALGLSLGQASAAILVVDDFNQPAGTTQTPVNAVYTTSTNRNLSRYQANTGLNTISTTREQSAQNNQTSYTTSNNGGDTAADLNYFSTVTSSTMTGNDLGSYSFANASTRYSTGTATPGTTYAGRGQGGLQYDGAIATTGTTRQMAKNGTSAAPLGRGMNLNLTSYKYLVFDNLAVSNSRTNTSAASGGVTNKAFQMTVVFNSRAVGSQAQVQYRYTRDILGTDDARYFYMPLTPAAADGFGWTRTAINQTASGVSGSPVGTAPTLSYISGIQVWFDNTGAAYGTNSKISFTRMYFSDTLIPEPSSIALAVCGVIGLGIAAKRRKK